jgi:hypothetical protein
MHFLVRGPARQRLEYRFRFLALITIIQYAAHFAFVDIDIIDVLLVYLNNFWLFG